MKGNKLKIAAAPVIGLLVFGIAGTLGGTSHPVVNASVPSVAGNNPQLCASLRQTHPAKAAALCTASDPYAAPSAPAPTANPAVLCGPWSDPNAPNTTAAKIQIVHGEVHNCLQIGTSWVITTLGGQGRAAAIGVYHCATTACLDGRNDPGLAGWKFIHSPYGGGATVLAVHGDTLVIDDAGHELNFDVDTEAFSGS